MEASERGPGSNPGGNTVIFFLFFFSLDVVGFTYLSMRSAIRSFGVVEAFERGPGSSPGGNTVIFFLFFFSVNAVGFVFLLSGDTHVR